jgi:hypothetical protein
LSIDVATRNLLAALLRRESRSLFQYLREVPPWAGPREQNAVARLRELAGAELDTLENLNRYLERQHAAPGPTGSYPDFTPFNDQALHFLLPAVVREQKQLLAELERDRPAVADEGAAAFLSRLADLKRRHIPELEALHTTPHTFTTVVV